jgi:putative ABC transport system ATP-binding protein
MAKGFIELAEVTKRYRTGEVTVNAVDRISFEIEKGELTVIVGPSGAGKTTVLNILGGMDTCDEGLISVDGEEVSRFTAKRLTTYRRSDIGFVFQFYNLIPNLTALENVELAAQICKNPLNALETLDEVGLKERALHFPAQLSGGEQQRVAIARALAKNPKLLLCDEPTGALDYATGKHILELLQRACRERGVTVVIITHNQAIAPMADRVIYVRNGKAEKVTRNASPVPVEQIEW